MGMNDTNQPPMSLRVPDDVRRFASKEAAAETLRIKRRVTVADILRDLMREGMAARQQPKEPQS